MIMLSKREKETLREISQWKEFYANWKPKTRAKLERMNLVANVSPKGCVENYQLTEKGHSLLQQLTEAGGVLMIPYILLSFAGGVALGFSICRDLVRQELKTKTLRIGKRLYRVVHETGVRK